jgi:hypothetical protein
MTHGFQQQDTELVAMPPTRPMPQHGKKLDLKRMTTREPRSVSPRPGHQSTMRSGEFA